ncbi:hypothetical protein [Mycobacterium dioxanotrophicus]|nr:hypothetical protein [Mycobacterium dioxanotrophicus]
MRTDTVLREEHPQTRTAAMKYATEALGTFFGGAAKGLFAVPTLWVYLVA